MPHLDITNILETVVAFVLGYFTFRETMKKSKLDETKESHDYTTDQNERLNEENTKLFKQNDKLRKENAELEKKLDQQQELIDSYSKKAPTEDAFSDGKEKK